MLFLKPNLIWWILINFMKFLSCIENKWGLFSEWLLWLEYIMTFNITGMFSLYLFFFISLLKVLPDFYVSDNFSCSTRFNWYDACITDKTSPTSPPPTSTATTSYHCAVTTSNPDCIYATSLKLSHTFHFSCEKKKIFKIVASMTHSLIK